MRLFDFIDSSHKENEDYTYTLEFFQWCKRDLEPGFYHQRRRCFFQVHYLYEGDYPGEKSLFRFQFSVFEPSGSSVLNIGFGVKLLSIDFSFFCDSWDFWRGR